MTPSRSEARAQRELQYKLQLLETTHFDLLERLQTLFNARCSDPELSWTMNDVLSLALARLYIDAAPIPMAQPQPPTKPEGDAP